MEIKEFLELSAGKWFSQRTSYHLDREKAENSKSEIIIEMLSPDHPEVVKLCEQHKINPSFTLGGTKASWDNSVDWGKAKQKGSTMIILVPDADNHQIGKLLRTMGNPKTTLIAGRYIMGNDEALTLIVEEGRTYSKERLWFASPNLRLRTSLLKHSGGFSTTSFYSEIRRVVPKAEQSAKDKLLCI
ncbi:MAG: phycobiliprotein lyase [Xenococcaceae cyanobacterium]